MITGHPPGAVAFARYAYPPNLLGYCGPDDHGALLEYADAQVVDGGLVQLARGFDGAWPYLQLIAGCSSIEDPLDARVVEAYWVGSPLLEAVGLSDLGSSLESRFKSRAATEWDRLAELIPAGSLPITVCMCSVCIHGSVCCRRPCRSTYGGARPVPDPLGDR